MKPFYDGLLAGITLAVALAMCISGWAWFLLIILPPREALFSCIP